MNPSDEYDPEDGLRIRLKRRDKVTKEFVFNYIKASSRVSKRINHYRSEEYEISCGGVWPWWNWKYNNRKFYTFDTRTKSVRVCGYISDRYLSRNSEEYKGVIMFITEKKLMGEL